GDGAVDAASVAEVEGDTVGGLAGLDPDGKLKAALAAGQADMVAGFEIMVAGEGGRNPRGVAPGEPREGIGQFLKPGIGGPAPVGEVAGGLEDGDEFPGGGGWWRWGGGWRGRGGVGGGGGGGETRR